jgi:hypothetical protein
MMMIAEILAPLHEEVESQHERARKTPLVEVPVDLRLQRHMVAEAALVDDLHRHVVADDLASCPRTDLLPADELFPMIVDQSFVIEDVNARIAR